MPVTTGFPHILLLTTVFSFLSVTAPLAEETSIPPFADEATVLTRYISVRPGLTSLAWESELNETTSSVADYHPFTGMFRISAGVLDHNYQPAADKGGDAATVRRSDFTVNRMDHLSKDLTASTRKPYVGFGWGASPSGDGSWTFNLDIGMMYQGNDCLNAVDTTRCMELNATPVDDLSVGDELEKYGWLPVLSGGITFKF